MIRVGGGGYMLYFLVENLDFLAFAFIRPVTNEILFILLSIAMLQPIPIPNIQGSELEDPKGRPHL